MAFLTTAEPRNADRPQTAPGLSKWLPALVFGTATALLVFVTAAHRLPLGLDEGIYLDGAVRILQGQAPYRDFFAITGPGSFWLLAGIFRIFGVELAHARLLLAFDFGLLTALTFWITRSISTGPAAWGAALLLLGNLLSIPGHLVLNHRWDSGVLVLAAIAASVSWTRSSRRSSAVLAGLFASLAAWITPSTALVGIVIAVWGLWRPELRRQLGGLFGGFLGGAFPALILAFQHAFVPMLPAMSWNIKNYSGPNRIGYGAILDSWSVVLGASPGFSRIEGVWMIASFLLPAILPPAIALASPVLKLRSVEWLLVTSGLAQVASTYPRWDLGHLAYVCPVFVILAATFVQGHLPPRAAVACFLFFAIPSGVMAACNLAGTQGDKTVRTAIGPVRLAADDATLVARCIATIRPGHTLFVFPYQPLFYLLTGGENPTRYSFLQPGMMTADDESAVLADLAAHPPNWVLYQEVREDFYLRLWPASDRRRLHMPEIENFLRANYRTFAALKNADSSYLLLQRTDNSL